MKEHLTTDELVERLYGVAPHEHVDHCPECSLRFERLCDRRAMAAEPPPETYEFLAAQRRTIYARMGENPLAGMKWLPALTAAAFLLAVGLVAYHPVGQLARQAAPHQNATSQTAKPEIDDAQLFADVYSMEQSMEPLAAKPIHAIFEDAQ
jgi:hypothetical protein